MVTNDPSKPVVKDGAVAVEGDKIVAVGRAEEVKRNYAAEEIVDARGKLVIPGMVNAHTHMFQALGRSMYSSLLGSMDTVDKDMWLWNLLERFLFPLSQVLTVEDVVTGANLACVEMVRSGITCVVDNHYGPTDKATVVKLAEALEKFGMRSVIARGIAPKEKPPLADKVRIPGHVFKYSSEEELRITEECILEVNRQSSLIQVWPAPLNEMYTYPETIRKAYELAEKHGVGLHTHIQEAGNETRLYTEEYGKKPVELLYELGVLSPKFHIVHGIYLTEEEIDLAGKTGATVVHNPWSNACFGTGVAPIPRLVEKGANIALGTDGVYENMFEALKMASGLQGAVHANPVLMPADKVFEFATLGGARALGLEKQLGSLEPGKKADLVVVNVKKPNMMPFPWDASARGLAYHLILFGVSAYVDAVIINGKTIMENGVLKTVDEDSVLEKAQETAESLRERVSSVTAGKL